MRLALLVVEHELNRLDRDEFFDDFKGVQGAKGGLDVLEWVFVGLKE